MPIERAEVIPYSLPFREPYVTARGRLERRELILLRVTDAEGRIGLGETTALSLRGGRPLDAIAAELRDVAWDDLRPERCSPEARCAIETALLDLELQRSPGLGAPAPLPVNATLSGGPVADVAAAAERWHALGFRTFKLKVGVGDDFEQVRAVREAVGADARIRIDANGTWRPVEARAFLAELEPLGIELCEQPVATLEEMAELPAATTIPLAADESVREPADSQRAAELGACAMATLKLAKVGGPVAAERGEWRLPVYLSSALDGPVGIAAAGRVAAEIRARGDGSDAGVAHGLATQLLFAETVAERGPEVQDGMLHLPDGPGLGVAIDEDALDRHRLGV